ncbi:hypothetical protein JTB14_001564 [Gonioctena quinquepunctata]|nr:hypothetical protein JTB14_001564 [Gonioctena quinquepunctata]
MSKRCPGEPPRGARIPGSLHAPKQEGVTRQSKQGLSMRDCRVLAKELAKRRPRIRLSTGPPARAPTRPAPVGRQTPPGISLISPRPPLPPLDMRDIPLPYGPKKPLSPPSPSRTPVSVRPRNAHRPARPNMEGTNMPQPSTLPLNTFFPQALVALVSKALLSPPPPPSTVMPIIPSPRAAALNTLSLPLLPQTRTDIPLPPSPVPPPPPTISPTPPSTRWDSDKIIGALRANPNSSTHSPELRSALEALRPLDRPHGRFRARLRTSDGSCLRVWCPSRAGK